LLEVWPPAGIRKIHHVKVGKEQGGLYLWTKPGKSHWLKKRVPSRGGKKASQEKVEEGGQYRQKGAVD